MSFLGEATSSEPPRPCDDYWKLIGEEGEVICDSDPSFVGRLLVRFDINVESRGLACHQQNPAWVNALWIPVEDLIMWSTPGA